MTTKNHEKLIHGVIPAAVEFSVLGDVFLGLSFRVLIFAMLFCFFFCFFLNGNQVGRNRFPHRFFPRTRGHGLLSRVCR